MKVRKPFLQGTLLFWVGLLFVGQPLFAQGAGKTLFESRSQELDVRTRSFHMEGDALLRNDSMELRAKQITIHFGSSEGEKALSGQNVESLRARQNVRILQDGLLSEGREAFYTSAKENFLLKGSPAKVSGTDFHVTGSEILYGLRKEEMAVAGSRETPSTFYHENDGSPLAIESEKQDWNMTKGQVVFSENIRAKTETRTLEADTLLVTYHRDEEGASAKPVATGRGNIIIDAVTAAGRVRITDAEGTGRGDKAVFTGNDDTLVLTGKPAEVTYRGHTIRGPQIRMNQKTGEMEVSGGASGRILPGDKK